MNSMKWKETYKIRQNLNNDTLPNLLLGTNTKRTYRHEETTRNDVNYEIRTELSRMRGGQRKK